MSKKIALLGSTGSIGKNALEVIDRLGYSVVVLSANTSIDVLEVQAQKYRPAYVAVADAAAADALKARFGGGYTPAILSGATAAQNAAVASGADIVLNAIVGIAGLSATLAALAAGTDVALANKESLVAGGALVMQEAAATGAALIPVDSEHSAIFQCLQDPFSASAVKNIWLTASGGPFYGKTRDELQAVTAEEALKHPNWAMGPKITVDSATLMNKGLELIEAMWLFSQPAEHVKIVVQRESIIHSLVEFEDNSILAQLGVPSMKLPIEYALTWPARGPAVAPPLDLSQLSALHFGAADEETFRCLAACRKAAKKGGLAPCAASGAGEEAVALFLAGKIGFLDIGCLVEACVDSDAYAGGATLDDIYACDAAARAFVREHV